MTNCKYCGGSKPKKRKAYCSLECRYAAMRSGVVQTCGVCGKSFWKHLSDIKYNRGFYCGRVCQATAARNITKAKVGTNGYVQFKWRHHPLASGRGYVYGHWLALYEAAASETEREALVRMKAEGWSIHHRNCVRDDNSVTNLELRAPGAHPKGWSIDEMVKRLEALGYKVASPEWMMA